MQDILFALELIDSDLRGRPRLTEAFSRGLPVLGASIGEPFFSDFRVEWQTRPVMGICCINGGRIESAALGSAD